MHDIGEGMVGICNFNGVDAEMLAIGRVERLVMVTAAELHLQGMA